MKVVYFAWKWHMWMVHCNKISFRHKCFIYRVEQLCFWLQIDWTFINGLNQKCRNRLARMALFEKILFDQIFIIFRAEQLCFWPQVDWRSLERVMNSLRRTHARTNEHVKKNFENATWHISAVWRRILKYDSLKWPGENGDYNDILLSRFGRVKLLLWPNY